MPPRKGSISRELRTIRTSFDQLARAFGRLVPALLTAQSTSNGTSPQRRARKRPRLTVARRAELKLQGRYLGTMRRLKPAQRAKVKKIRAAKGVRAAIKAAERMAR